MESIGPGLEKGHLQRLHSEISRDNAIVLGYLHEKYNLSFTELARKAIAVYDYAIEAYSQGEVLAIELDDGLVPIPLLDLQPNGNEGVEPRVSLSVHINEETAEVLHNLGLQGPGADTRVMDHVLHAYGFIESYAGQYKIGVYKSDGTCTRSIELM